MTRFMSGGLLASVEITMSLFKKILVPIDGSSSANKALAYALKLAQADHADVRLVYCIDELSLLSSHEYSGEMAQLARESGHKILQDGMALANAAHVKADTRLIDRVGQRLGESVADAAGDWGADLVVIGTHGRRGIGRVLLGSGAEQVMRMSPVPVLMVRGSD
jgi:nucleotide-binding universal stress UspA family protein